ncbi:MAG TPA: uroporphyrinogen decarboxylase [Candidatus Krumholzibacteria bacterium]|nr:uroporphyrinogen decarboxylase [Candidatus Krumholzibacteria bacterium]HPD71183.1 uroporphyrinogen decarboxylase [Candidatus Krumholzibacteria bacterium]HRY39117.1 uroporphyrinogen decarboxylase [Candidatus Krumholzibacteria bacterium]
MTKTEPATAPLLAALRGERPSRRPIWIMRQAGRYLPEYRAVRERASFHELCTTPELACEVTLQPLRRWDLDAGIIFSDILTPLAPMGAEFDFSQGAPRLAAPLRDERELGRLRVVDPRDELGFVAEAIRMVRRERPQTPLIGFAGAPLTLAAYLVEGGGSQDFHHFKTLLYSRPELIVKLLDTLTDQVALHLAMQVEAGCAAIQVFDSWASILHPGDYRRFALPPLRRLMDRLAPLGAPRILFSKGGRGNLATLLAAGADCLSLDWTCGLADAAAEAPGSVLQGNLDPVVLFGSSSELVCRTQAVCRAGDRAAGHVFNLGHGILPQTSPDAVSVLVETVHAHRQEA